MLKGIKEFFHDSEALRDNELDANKQMVIACGATSLVLLAFLILYIFKVFILDDYTLVYIFLPIDILLLLSPLPLSRTKQITKSWFKNYLIALLLMVVAIINIVLPRHGVLGWALPIVLVNHYYSKRFGLITFVNSIVLMLVCLYVGMLVGEYDPHLLTEGVVRFDETLNEYYVYRPSLPSDRIEFLRGLRANNDNRYIKVFTFYYIPRALVLGVIFAVSQALNRRTYNLLQKERDISLKNEKIVNELQIAHQIQSSALPKPDFHNDVIAIHAGLFPAREIGGDLYDYFLLDRNHLAFLIGDVSGKGAPAALFMMKAITCFKDAVSLDKTPLQIMSEVNASLYEGNEEGQMFVTAFFGILDLRNGELRYVNAGHCPPLISRGGRFSYLPCATGFVLGAMDMCVLKEETVTLEPGAIFALYTDGITEAVNGDNELFGMKRLLQSVNKMPYRTLNEFYREIQDDLAHWVGSTEQSDDLTAMAIHYLYEDIHVEELSMEADINQVDKAIAFVTDNLKGDSHTSHLLKPISIVVDEVYSNIAKYAYGGKKGSVFIRYCYYKKTNNLVLTFIDRGVAYDPTKKKLDEKPALEKEGGLGLLIVSNIMDDVDYDRRNNKNFLVLTKKIQ